MTQSLLIGVGGILLIVVLVILVLLWAFTEELPKGNRVPLHEQLEEGHYAVRLEAVSRRKMKAVRVINEVIGGDFGAAMKIAEAVPITLIEGISEESAGTIVKALTEAGAHAEVITA